MVNVQHVVVLLQHIQKQTHELDVVLIGQLGVGGGDLGDLGGVQVVAQGLQLVGDGVDVGGIGGDLVDALGGGEVLGTGMMVSSS